MKTTLMLVAMAVSMIACEKAADQKEFKTAFVDTAKMMEDYTETKDLEAKYKAKSQEMGKELDAEMQRFNQERQAFEQKARALGEVWAQQNSGPLVRKGQQLQMAQDQLLRQIQNESGAEMDTLVKKVKLYIKDYGKKKGYDYVFATGDVVSILYAKDSYDITKDVVKELNDKYAADGKKETAAPAPSAATPAAPAKEEEAKK